MPCQYQRFIKMTQRSLGLDDDTYRDFLEAVTGKRSTTEMTLKQRWRVVEALKAKGVAFESTKSAKFGGTKAARRPDAPRDDRPQSRLIRHLWLRLKDLGVLRDPSERALLAYVKGITGNVRMEWCQPEQLATVIETLKKWIGRVEADLALKDRA